MGLVFIWLRSFLSSQKFFGIVLLIFFLQALWFAVSVKYKIPPDEIFHFTFINFYSEQPITSGPLIPGQESLVPYVHGESSDSGFMRDIQRIPGYLYHYFLSFILRMVSFFTEDLGVKVFALRFINILIALSGLIVFKKLFSKLTSSQFTINITLALVTSVTMFVGVAGSINYDNAKFLISSASLLFLVKIIQKQRIKDIFILVLLLSLGLLVKKTFILVALPITLVLLIDFFILNSRNLDKFTKNAKKDFFGSFKLNIVFLILLLIPLGLVFERYAYNQVNYGSLTPACTDLYKKDICMKNSLFKRNYQQKMHAEAVKEAGGGVAINPMEHSSDWVYRMYSGSFFYLGHQSIHPNSKTIAISMVYVATIASFVVLYYRRGEVLESPIDKYLVFIAVFFIAGVFIFNLNTYMSLHAKFGYQGRYLLPVLPIILFFLVKSLRTVMQSLLFHKKSIQLITLFLLSIIILFNHLPILVFYRGTNQDWYTNKTKVINTRVQSFLTDTKIAPKNTLRN